MRLFIGICLPPEIKQQLYLYAKAIGAQAEKANITREENFHLTLAFLGDALREEDACAVMEKIKAAPFKLYSAKPGSFQRGGSSIFWLGLKSSPELTSLHQQLHKLLGEAGFKSEENRPFTPHLTLGREIRGISLSQLEEAPRFILPVDTLTLMESSRIQGTLTYSPKFSIYF